MFVISSEVLDNDGYQLGRVTFTLTAGTTEYAGVAIPNEYVLTVDALPGDPTVAITYRVVDGAPQAVDAHITGTPQTVSLFDNVATNWRQWGDVALQAVMHHVNDTVQARPVSEGARSAAMKAVQESRSRMNQALLEEVAMLYEGNYGNAGEIIAARFDVSVRTARRYIAEAKRKGWISEAEA